MNIINFDKLEIFLSGKRFVFGGSLMWRQHKYYECCGTTYLTNYSWIYVDDINVEKTKVLKNGKFFCLIMYKEFPDDINIEGDDEWWIVDMLNHSLIADKCSFELIVKRIINCINKGIINYNYDKLKSYVILYGNNKVKSYF